MKTTPHPSDHPHSFPFSPTQFCQDFSIKSTALLTATQLGDIYLTIVPLQSTSAVQGTDAHRHCESAGEGLMVAGMSFELFCRALMFMALVAYRNLDAAVPTTYKVSDEN
jgi:hypothetical protein